MSQIPEIKAEALLDLVIDEDRLRKQLSKSLGTTIEEAAKSAKLGDNLLPPKELRALRTELRDTFSKAAKEFGEALGNVSSKEMRETLAALRTETAKVFENDLRKLSATGALPQRRHGGKIYPAIQVNDAELKGGIAGTLKQLVGVFGADGLRRGDYADEGKLRRMAYRAKQLQDVYTELAGLPAVAEKDLQALRKITNSKDTEKYLRMQAAERENLAKSSAALNMQTQSLQKLSSLLGKAGFGELASEISAANTARKKLVANFREMTAPPAIEAAQLRSQKSSAKDAQKVDSFQRKLRDDYLKKQQAELDAEARQAAADAAKQNEFQQRLRQRYLEQQAKEAAKVADAARKQANYQANLQAGYDRQQREADRKASEAAAKEARKQANYQADLRARQERLDRQEQEKSAQQAVRDAARVNEAQQQSRLRSATGSAAIQDARRIIGNAGGIGKLTNPLDIRDVSAGFNAARREAIRAVATAKEFFGEQSVQYQDAMKSLDMVKADRQQLASRIKELAPVKDNSEKLAQQAARRDSSYEVAKELIRRNGGIGGISDNLTLRDVSTGLNAQLRRLNEQALIMQRAGKETTEEYRKLNDEVERLRGLRSSVELRRGELAAAGRGGGGDGGDTDLPDRYSPTERLLSNFGKYALGYGALYSVVSAVQQLVSELVELDRSFYSIKAVTQATDREMRSISRSIREVALSTSFSSREIAGAAELLGQAGVAPANMDRALMATAQFASATNSSLETAADLLTTVQKVYSEVEDSTIADQLTQAINLSKLSAEDLKTILSLTSQTAASYNVSLEQLLGAVTTLRNAGIKPSTVATGLRQAMLEVFNPDTNTTKALSSRYQQLGENLDDKQIRQRFFSFKNSDNPLLAAVTELRRIGFTDEGQQTLQRGFDVRAFNALSALVNNYQAYETDATKITFGQASVEGAEIQLQSLTATLENLGSSVVALSEQIGGDLLRDVQSFAEGLTEAVEGLTELDLSLKAEGKGGITDVAQGAAFGGIAGALAGKGIRGRLLGGAIGALGGGGASYFAQQADDGELGLGDVAEVASLVAFLGGALAGLLRKFRVVGKAGQLLAKLPGVDRLTKGAGAGEIGDKVGGILGLVTGAGAIFAVLEAVFDLIPEGELEQLQAQSKAAQENAARARDRLSKLQATLNQYDVDAAAPAEGTFPATLQKYREALANSALEAERIFGRQVEGRIQELVENYTGQTASARGTSLDELRSLTGNTELSDKEVFDFATQLEQLSNTVNAMRESIGRRLQLDLEEAAKARANGEQADAQVSARLQAAGELGADFTAVINGNSDLDFDEQRKLMEEYTRTVYRILNETPKLEAAQKEAQLKDLELQLASSLAAADNSAEIALLVASIGSSVTAIGTTAQERLAAIQNAISLTAGSIDADIAALQAERSGLGFSLPGVGQVYMSDADRARQKQIDAQLAILAGKRGQLDQSSAQAEQEARDAELRKQRQRQADVRKAGDTAYAQLNEFSSNRYYREALASPQAMREMGLTAQDVQFIKQYSSALSGNAEAGRQLVGQITATPAEGQVNQIAQTFSRVASVFAASAEKESKERDRAARDAENRTSLEQQTRLTKAKVAIQKAEYGKDYAALTGDNGLVKQFYDAQRVVLEKELARAKADADDAKEDGADSYESKALKVVELQAKLDTLPLEMEKELEKYRQRIKTASDQDAKKQAKIDTTQTAIEQRKVKQAFDEAIRVGSIPDFTTLSAEYERVQAKLVEQLEKELEARGYTAEQIEAEISLREDLNKPLAEQVENIRKLFDQRAQLRDLRYQEVGTGPDLGGAAATAYLGQDGFTNNELAGAASRDVALLASREAEIKAELVNAANLGQDEEVLGKLKKELQDVQTQLGETKYQLDNLVKGSDGALREVFDGRQWVIGLEQTGLTFENMGDNLRSNLLTAWEDIGTAITRAITEGEDFGDAMESILFTLAQNQFATMLQTNLNEGLEALISGGNDWFNQAGLGTIGSWFGMGEGSSSPATAAAQGTATTGIEKLGQTLSESMQETAVMNVQAGVVNVGSDSPFGSFGNGVTAENSGGGGGGLLNQASGWLGGLFNGGTTGTTGANIGAAAAQYGPEVAKMGGNVTAQQAAATTTTGAGVSAGGGMMGAFGGAGMGMGIGAALGGAIGGEKGSKWGAIIGALAGAYFGFGMASGGYIDKFGRVVGSPGSKRGVDSVPVLAGRRPGRLAPGEGVLNTRAMDMLGGEDFLHAANTGRLARASIGSARTDSYNASQATRATGSRSVAMAMPELSMPAPEVIVKNVNVFDKQEIRSAFVGREGEDVMINRLRRRGAIK